MQYLIWSFEHSAWWGWSRRGYVQEIGAAGIYSQEEAEEICNDANLTGLNEAMVPLSKGFIEGQIAMYGQHEEEESGGVQYVTRSMAYDAGDPSMEGYQLGSHYDRR